MDLKPFKILLRNKIIKEINNEKDFLVFINENFYKTDNFIKIVNSFKKFINDNIEDTITKTEFYTILKKFKRTSRFSKMYWLKRGYSRKETIKKVFEIQSKNSKKVKRKRENNPRCIEYYLNKGYSEKEAKEKLREFQKKCSPRTIEYWLNKGYSEKEAKEKLKEFQNNSKYINYNKRLTNTQLDYYIKQGYSKEEAKKKLKERQKTFTLKKLIYKYGPIKGYIRWYNRQEKWQNTLNYKSDEEKQRIKEKKLISIKKYSKESIEFFNPIYNFLIQNGFSDKDIYWKENEYFIYDKTNKTIYFYDFTVPKLNLIIEYHGSIWHYNPNYKYPENFKEPFLKRTLNEMKAKDDLKRNLAIQNKFEIIEVFDTDDKNKKQKEIINFIINKYKNRSF